MGRGRAKAKQTKVARDLKYGGPQTDLDRLQAELSRPDSGPLGTRPSSPAPGGSSEHDADDIDSDGFEDDDFDEDDDDVRAGSDQAR
ncbi:MAG: DUF3073 domain-containing protein [Actinomycetota bacterium]|nr:MAG: DUF3073 domain-containing protein [Actinomycetota bacterium]